MLIEFSGSLLRFNGTPFENHTSVWYGMVVGGMGCFMIEMIHKNVTHMTAIRHETLRVHESVFHKRTHSFSCKIISQ